MLISSRGRYRLQVMIDLVKHTEQRYTSLKEIAERQGFSLHHLGNILPALEKQDHCRSSGKRRRIPSEPGTK